MGLDQYAYVAAKAGQQSEYYEAEGDYVDGEWKPHKSDVAKPREIAYWRKHPNLQGWMEQLWIKKRNAANQPVVEDPNDWGSTFNGVELELTLEDLNRLEDDIKYGEMAKLGTTGFFFGNPSDDHYRLHDLEFIKNAKAELFCGLKVFYNSSW